MERANREDRRYPSLDELARLPRAYFKERAVKPKEIPFLWQAYQRTGDKRKISLVVRHCMEDLIQTLWVLAHTKL